jgi:hypothetical protein
MKQNQWNLALQEQADTTTAVETTEEDLAEATDGN